MNGDEIGLPDAALMQICQVFSQYPSVEQVLIYGSRATGHFKKNSDIDLTLIGNGLSWQILLVLMDKLDDLLLPWMIDLSIFAMIQNPDLREHIQRVGKVLYDRATMNTAELSPPRPAPIA